MLNMLLNHFVIKGVNARIIQEKYFKETLLIFDLVLVNNFLHRNCKKKDCHRNCQ